MASCVLCSMYKWTRLSMRRSKLRRRTLSSVCIPCMIYNVSIVYLFILRSQLICMVRHPDQRSRTIASQCRAILRLRRPVKGRNTFASLHDWVVQGSDNELSRDDAFSATSKSGLSSINQSIRPLCDVRLAARLRDHDVRGCTKMGSDGARIAPLLPRFRLTIENGSTARKGGYTA